MNEYGRYNNAFKIKADLALKEGFEASLYESSSSPFLSYPSARGSASGPSSWEVDLSGARRADAQSIVWPSVSEFRQLKGRAIVALQAEIVHEPLSQIIETATRMADEHDVYVFVTAKEFGSGNGKYVQGYRDGYRDCAGGVEPRPRDAFVWAEAAQLPSYHAFHAALPTSRHVIDVPASPSNSPGSGSSNSELDFWSALIVGALMIVLVGLTGYFIYWLFQSNWDSVVRTYSPLCS